MKILVVDDEKEIADLIEIYLQNEGYEVFKFNRAEGVLSLVDRESISLAILDVMLPDGDGLELLRQELMARVKTQLRRYTRYNMGGAPEEAPSELTIRGLTIDRDTHKVRLNGSELVLTPIEFSILRYLCEHRGKVVTSEELYEKVWGEEFLDCNNTVMAHIARLRSKMHEPSRRPKYIKTVWGVGYTIE